MTPASARPLSGHLARRRKLRRQARLTDTLNLGLVLLILNLLARNLGPLSIEWSKALAAVLLLALMFVNLRWPPRLVSAKRCALGAGAIVVSWFLLLAIDRPILAVALSAGVIWGIAEFLRGVRSRLPGVAAYAGTAATYAALVLALNTVPRLSDAMVSAAVTWSRVVGRALVDQPLECGPAGMGGGVLGSVLCYLLVNATLRRRHNRSGLMRLMMIAAALLIANAIYLYVQNQPAWLPQNALALFLSQALFLGLGILMLSGVRVARSPGPARAPGSRWLSAAGLILTGCAAFALTIWPGPKISRPITVFFFDSGFLDWNRPIYGRYGAYESGLFGCLPDYLQAAGAQCRIDHELTADRLGGSDVLVVINPTNRWASHELKVIWNFVADGGSLLVLGDHTDIMGSRAVLNALLAPVNVRFNFDSGFPARPEWRDCLSAMLHPCTQDAVRASDAVISVGASLQVGWPAFTVLRGRYGFSDLGNQLNVPGAFLGDYRYQKGEQLGDVALVAAAYHGRGKVLVFGDTSPFQNAALAFSYVRFVHHVMHWLGTRDWPGWGLGKGAWAVFLTLAALLLLRRMPRVGSLALAATLVTGIALGQAAQSRRTSPPVWNGAMALIDRAHANRFSLAPLQKNSIGPLTVTLLRNGFLPLLAEAWSEENLKTADLLVITAPAKRFSGRELRAVRNFASRGGIVLINSGWEEKGAAVKSLLDEFALDILRVPLGPYPVTRTNDHLSDQVQFINAWPVVVTDPQLQGAFARARESYRPPLLDSGPSRQLAQVLSPLLGGKDFSAPATTDNRATPIAAPNEPVHVLAQTTEGFPIVIARTVGKGSVVLIGDTFFLGNDNLENLQYYRKGNLLFLKHLFETVRQERRDSGRRRSP